MQANIDQTVDQEEFSFLLTWGIVDWEVPLKPLPCLGYKLWAEMNRLSSLLGFVGFAEEVQKDPVSFCRRPSMRPRSVSALTCLHARKGRNDDPVRAMEAKHICMQHSAQNACNIPCQEMLSGRFVDSTAVMT